MSAAPQDIRGLIADHAAEMAAVPDGERRCFGPGCARPYRARGLCAMHYSRVFRNPDRKLDEDVLLR